MGRRGSQSCCMAKQIPAMNTWSWGALGIQQEPCLRVTLSDEGAGVFILLRWLKTVHKGVLIPWSADLLYYGQSGLCWLKTSGEELPMLEVKSGWHAQR